MTVTIDQIDTIPRTALIWLQTIPTSYGSIAAIGRIEDVVRTSDGQYLTLTVGQSTGLVNRHTYRLDDVDHITLLQEGLHNV